MAFAKHECSPDSALWCFSCRKPICRECMIVGKDQLVCKSCSPKGARVASVQKKNPNAGLYRLEFAAVFYSFVIAKLLYFLGGAGGILMLVAALLGVAVTELLRRMTSTEMLCRQVYPLAASAILLGLFACRLTDQLFVPKFSMESQAISDAISMALLLGTMWFRFSGSESKLQKRTIYLLIGANVLICSGIAIKLFSH